MNSKDDMARRVHRECRKAASAQGGGAPRSEEGLPDESTPTEAIGGEYFFEESGGMGHAKGEYMRRDDDEGHNPGREACY